MESLPQNHLRTKPLARFRALGIVQQLLYQVAELVGFITSIGSAPAVRNIVHLDAVTSFMLKIVNLLLEPSSPQVRQYKSIFAGSGPDISRKEVAEALVKTSRAESIITSPSCRSVGLQGAGESGVAAVMSHGIYMLVILDPSISEHGNLQM